MPAIVCPQPRPASSSSDSSPANPASPSGDSAPLMDAALITNAPPRLLSPIHLNTEMDSRNIFYSPSSCSPRKRRCSPHDNMYRSPRRQRQHCSAADCHFTTLGVFDRMSWITQEAAAMDFAERDVTDVLECSYQEVEWLKHSEPSSAGPIRTPRGLNRPGSTDCGSPVSREHSSHPRASFPRHEFLTLSPRTPPRRPTVLSEVRFRGLLPVLP
ncbi:hypothetical protein GLOTRDRAFT_110064 [Gloeophyllum trabeum ATCC 11539]|uniref:Uncharacterized protein n=1 Tax=Gloeophyllum trabeum (strain ATCC 11539 / FP-39264 / Madison 617) TaxID=670483 RepID=S7RXT7_GLOTA|nr:uncharacterized protein GLOTRDRAFT_110064 [Gloeophyllum trabeum ATCC 11539]EPQ58189.1 hypothetical protein GLOTRDRAFT_110064 [Gloeophyllum trabeum ATCC 11539]